MTIRFYEHPGLYEKGAGGTPDQGRARSADVHAY
jgi:hypothetical protein